MGGALVSGGASATACAVAGSTGAPPAPAASACRRRCDQWAAPATAPISSTENGTLRLPSDARNRPQPTSATRMADSEAPSTRPDSSRRPSFSVSPSAGISSQAKP